ncbi:hypothetical protein AAVH_19032 [Aphelenchoides avenae]|nr:hypothetical protein AAVH_19032 [Aphelenchus avenae]
MIVVLAGGIWIAETAVICVSIRAIIRYRATTRRAVNSSAPGGSLLTQLGPLLCFSALPCLETLSSVYMSLGDVLTIASHTAAIECANAKMESYNVSDYSLLPVADIYDDCGAVPVDYFNTELHR